MHRQMDRPLYQYQTQVLNVAVCLSDHAEAET